MNIDTWTKFEIKKNLSSPLFYPDKLSVKFFITTPQSYLECSFTPPPFLHVSFNVWFVVRFITIFANSYSLSNCWNVKAVKWQYRSTETGYKPVLCKVLFLHNVLLNPKRKRQRDGVNFTNILLAAFTLIDPESVKKIDNLTVFLMLLGSTRVKAASKTLVKLNPVSCLSQ